MILNPKNIDHIKIEPAEGHIHVIFKYKETIYGVCMKLDAFHNDVTLRRAWNFVHDNILDTLRDKDFQFPQEIAWEE